MVVTIQTKENEMVPFQWPDNPNVETGDVVADAGCLNQRAYRQGLGLDQPECHAYEVVRVFSWGLRVKSDICGDEFDVTDWFIPNAKDNQQSEERAKSD
jgi:hypothetical protein